MISRRSSIWAWVKSNWKYLWLCPGLARRVCHTSSSCHQVYYPTLGVWTALGVWNGRFSPLIPKLSAPIFFVWHLQVNSFWFQKFWGEKVSTTYKLATICTNTSRMELPKLSTCSGVISTSEPNSEIPTVLSNTNRFSSLYTPRNLTKDELEQTLCNLRLQGNQGVFEVLHAFSSSY